MIDTSRSAEYARLGRTRVGYAVPLLWVWCASVYCVYRSLFVWGFSDYRYWSARNADKTSSILRNWCWAQVHDEDFKTPNPIILSRMKVFKQNARDIFRNSTGIMGSWSFSLWCRLIILMKFFCCLLGFDMVWSCRWLPVFPKDLLPSTLG